MKRLLCYYEKKQDATYPWLLKHPKIKSGLAKFKTRQEAIQWYMLLKFETSIWFQNDQKIFGGQLSIDNEDDSWYNYVKVSGFDGGETYEGVCDEFGIDPRTFQYDYATAEKRLENLDFVLLHDPYTYFPPELEISKKSRKEMLDIDKVNELLAQREKEIKDQHEQELQEKEEEIIDLKKELQEKEDTTTEVIVENRETRIGYSVYYRNFADLDVDKQLDALALYYTKIRDLTKKLETQQISSSDYERITRNFELVSLSVKDYSQKVDEETKDLLTKLAEQFNRIKSDLFSKLSKNERLANIPEHFAYVFDEDKEQKVSVAYETSYVLMGIAHVGFIEESKYEYPIDYIVDPNKYGVAIISLKDVFEKVEPLPQPEPVYTKPEPQSQLQPQASENIRIDDMPEFWTGKIQPQTLEYIDNYQLLLDKNNIHKRKRWHTAWLIALVLLLVAVGIILVLAIVQLADGTQIFKL